VYGALVFAVGETLKLVMVERLFHINRDKLMSIPAIRLCYVRIRTVLAWLDVVPRLAGHPSEDRETSCS